MSVDKIQFWGPVSPRSGKVQVSACFFSQSPCKIYLWFVTVLAGTSHVLTKCRVREPVQKTEHPVSNNSKSHVLKLLQSTLPTLPTPTPQSGHGACLRQECTQSDLFVGILGENVLGILDILVSLFSPRLTYWAKKTRGFMCS